MAATASVEEIKHAAPGCTRWFQAHVLQDREMMRRMVVRAERAGFSAVVLTVDCAVHGKRYKDLRNQFSLPPHLKSVTQRGPLCLESLDNDLCNNSNNNSSDDGGASGGRGGGSIQYSSNADVLGDVG